MQINKELHHIYSDNALIDLVITSLSCNKDFTDYLQEVAKTISNIEEEEQVE